MIPTVTTEARGNDVGNRRDNTRVETPNTPAIDSNATSMNAEAGVAVDPAKIRRATKLIPPIRKGTEKEIRNPMPHDLKNDGCGT